MNWTHPQLDSFKTPKGALKLVYVILAIIAIATFSSAYSNWVIFVGFVIASGLVYGISICITYLYGNGQFQTTFYEPMMDSYFSLMFFIAAIICWSKASLRYLSGSLISTGIFCLIGGILFAVDGYFTLISSGTLDILRGASATTNNSQQNPAHQVPVTNQTHDINEPPPAYRSPSVSEHPPVFPTQTTIFPATITNTTISK